MYRLMCLFIFFVNHKYSFLRWLLYFFTLYDFPNVTFDLYRYVFFFSSRRRHTWCALGTGVQTCALPICSPHDRRSFHVRAAAKGIDVYRNLSTLFDQHAGQLNDIQLSSDGLDAANHALRRLQQFWSTPASLARNLSPAA